MEDIGDLRTNFVPTRKNSRNSIERKMDQLLDRGISFVSKVSKELLHEIQNESPQHINENCESTNSLEGSWLVVSDQRETEPDRFEEFFDLLVCPVVDIDLLRRLGWHGIPETLRGTCWQLLLGYLPCESNVREKVLLQKSAEYKQLVLKYTVKEEQDPELLQQIRVDVPRTNLKGMEGLKLFTFEAIKLLLERVLYIWTKEHKGLDYYQGLSDIAAQFIVVFLSQNLAIEQLDANCFTQELLEKLEVDTFWCMSIMLHSLEDHYANNLNTGIQKSMDKLKNLIRLSDAQLADHLESQSVEFIHFSFRWWICFLSREFHYKLTSRLWDTYMAEGSCFASFHSYVCASFLLRWSEELKKMEFSELVMFLQHLPTDHWGFKDTAQLIEGAYCIGYVEKNYLDFCSFGILLLAVLVLILSLLYGVCTLLKAAGASHNFL